MPSTAHQAGDTHVATRDIAEAVPANSTAGAANFDPLLLRRKRRRGDTRFAEGHEVLSDLAEHVAVSICEGDDEPLRDVVNEFAEAGRAAMASAEWWDKQQLRTFVRAVAAGDDETAAEVLDGLLRARALLSLVHIADAVEAAHEQEQLGDEE